MKLFNLQIPETARKEPDHVLRLPDSDHRRPGLLAKPGSQFKRRQEAGRFGRPHPGGFHQFCGWSSGETAERSLADLKQGPGNINGRGAANPGPQQHRQEFGRGQCGGAERPQSFARAITVGKCRK